ncbi:DUF2459 domain-containing protein [Dankookia sp. GCM10030260]|uniref:DUF2459 domain-containing protein n=1 Tax=Dankookia sp. GCM10030260 TaxID=3273390 RepID=UPI00361888BF
MTIAAVTRRRKVMTLGLALLAGCARQPPLPCAARPVGPIAWVVDQGWHTEIALRAADLTGPLARFRTIFAGAETVVFGFGKRSYVLAEAGAFAELLLGPLPGPGVVQLRGLRAPPAEAWPGRAAALPLTTAGLVALSGFIRDSIAPQAEELALHGSLFLAASRDYTLAFTCNTWTAAGLQRAGLPVDPAGVVLAGALLAQLRPLGCAA